MWDDVAKSLKVVESDFAKQRVWNYNIEMTAGLVGQIRDLG